MSGKGSATIALSAGLIAAVLGVGSWFFYFSATFDAIDEATLAAASQKEFNDTVEIRVLALKRDFERLPEVTDEINEVAKDLPPVEDVPGFVRTVGELVDEHNVVLMRLNVEVPATVDNSITLARAAAVYGQRSYVEDLVFSGLIGTAFRIEVIGAEEDVFAFVEALQTGPHRYFLVETFNRVTLAEGPAEGARPAIGPGWIEATMTGAMFTFRQEGVDPNLKPGIDGEIPIQAFPPESTDDLSDEADEPAT